MQKSYEYQVRQKSAFEVTSKYNGVQHGAHALHNVATHHLLHLSFEMLLGIHLADIGHNTLLRTQLLLLHSEQESNVKSSKPSPVSVHACTHTHTHTPPHPPTLMTLP